MSNIKQLYKDACTTAGVKCNSAVFSELPDAAGPTFTHWDLSNKMLGIKGLATVLTIVDQLPQLTSINLSGNNLSSPSTKELLVHLSGHPAITTVDLSNNDIRLGGPELVDLVKRNRRIKYVNLDNTFLRPLFVRLIEIQLKKAGGDLLTGQGAAPPAQGTTENNKAATSADPTTFTVGGGGRRTRGSGGVQFGEPPASTESPPPAASADGGRFSFGDAAADQDEAYAAAEEEAFGNFRQQLSTVQFDANAAGGKKVPRRPTVCSEVYKEEEIDNFVPDVIDKDPKVKQYLLSLLERHDLFSHLEDYELSVAVDAMYERENSAGDALYEEGEESDTFYVIYHGKVETRHGDDVVVKKKGDTLQALMLLYPDVSRETAVCVEDAILYTLDRQTYRCILSKASKKKRALYEGFLSTIGFLKAANLTRSEILSLADALKADHFEAGGSLIKYGQVGETFYIIAEGVVEVFGRDDNHNTIKVCEFTVGDCVGELEFINNHKCVADVKAKGFVRVAKMNRHHFEMVMGPVKDVLARNASENTVYEYYRHQLEKMEQQAAH